MSLSELREEALERDGYRCVWPGCQSRDDLEMAHLEPKGMGGRPSVNVIDNVAILCRRHHSLLDGRSHYGLKRELLYLLEAYLGKC